jgi:RNA polymerase sigma-70 factor (ECF subfamily)
MTEQDAEGQITELYRRLGRSLYGTALRMMRSREEAEDAVHDAFVAMQRQGPGFAPANPGGWLHRVVVNACLDRLRSRARWQETESEDEGVFGTVGAAPVGQRLDLERAVARLPEGARMVFLLHDVEGMQHDEVSAALGISVGTSKSQLFRAREILRTALGGRAAGATS